MPGDLTVGERDVAGLSAAVADPGLGAADWRLTVVEGPNRDARLDLPPGSYRIGDDADADILLADPGAGAPALRLIVPGAGPALLRAEAEGARFAGRPLRAGEARPVTRGGELRLGATVIRLEPPVALLVRMDGRRRAIRWRVAGAAAAAVILAAAGALGPLLLTDVGARPEDRRAAAARPEPARVDRDAARGALAARLQEAELGADRLRVSDGANGALLVEGRLNAAETARFAEVRRWYDAAHGAGPALVARLGVDIAPPRPALRIRAVSLAPVPYVIASDGEKYGEGAVLEDGWVIESIDRERVVMRRGAETSVVTL